MGVSSRDCRILFSSHTKKRVPWRRKWQPTPVPLLGKSHGESSVQPSMEYNRAGHGLATKKQMAVLANVWEQTLVRNWGVGLKPTSYCWQMWMLFRKTKINCKQIFEKKKKCSCFIVNLLYQIFKNRYYSLEKSNNSNLGWATIFESYIPLFS